VIGNYIIWLSLAIVIAVSTPSTVKGVIEVFWRRRKDEPEFEAFGECNDGSHLDKSHF